MSNELISIEQAAGQLPAAMRDRMKQGLATNKNFEEGVRDAYPVLSIKGKVFRARIAGQETAFVDPNTRLAYPFVDVVLVNASRTLAKTYYIKGYTEGDLNPPDCWSLDSVRPDASVANKVSPSCLNCPMNAFGSRITENGKQAKACGDARRVAVVLPHMLNNAEPLIMMLRVPQSSLKNLKAYAQLLERHGIDPVGVTTRLQFDYADAFPKLQFNFVNVLPEATYNRVVELAEGAMVQGMLSAPDFDQAITTPNQQNPQQGAGLQPLKPQEVVLEDPSILGGAQQQAPVQHAAAKTVIVNPGELVELPDGRYYNQVTKQYVEAQTQQQAVPDDPATLELPEGKFFNMNTKTYVTSKALGAPAVSEQAPAVAPTVTRKRTAKPKDTPSTPPAGGQTPLPLTDLVDQAQALAAAVAGANQQAVVDNKDKQADAPVTNGGDAPGTAPVTAAPSSLEALLKSVLPVNPQ